MRRTRSASGEYPGLAISSSSLRKTAPPAASSAATAPACSGVNPSAGFTIAPTETPGSAPKAGPGSPSGQAISTSRHDSKSPRSAHSPAMQTASSCSAESSSASAGNSTVTRGPSTETTRARTDSGPSGRLTDWRIASVSAHSGGRSS